MELSACIEKRRSIRKYAEGEITKEVLMELVKSAQKAPSWKNSQTARFYCTATAESKIAFMDCLPEFNQNNTANAGAYIVSTVVTGRSGFNADGSYTGHLGEGWQYFDNGLAVENLCLTACDMGLGTLIMGIYDEKKVREFFHIPQTEQVVAVISVGKPDISPDMPKRNALEEVIFFK